MQRTRDPLEVGRPAEECTVQRTRDPLEVGRPAEECTAQPMRDLHLVPCFVTDAILNPSEIIIANVMRSEDQDCQWTRSQT